MTIKNRIKTIEEQRLIGDEKLHLDECPEGASLEEATRIYENNLRKLNEHARRYPPKRDEEDVGPPMTLEEATRIYEENFKRISAGRSTK